MATKDPEKRRQQWRSWYERNKNTAKHRDRLRAFDKKRQKELRVWFHDLKSQLKCSKCPNSHPAIIDFHHRDPTEKEHNVADMVTKRLSRERILREIEKCDVYCSNCHRILHYELENNLPLWSSLEWTSHRQ